MWLELGHVAAAGPKVSFTVGRSVIRYAVECGSLWVSGMAPDRSLTGLRVGRIELRLQLRGARRKSQGCFMARGLRQGLQYASGGMERHASY